MKGLPGPSPVAPLMAFSKTHTCDNDKQMDTAWDWAGYMVQVVEGTDVTFTKPYV